MIRIQQGTTMTHALIYESQAEPALTDAELELVLLKSRTLNAMRGVTGALLKRGDRIVQYLEGEPDALARTLARIEASPLHRDLRVIARADDIPRVFDRWHMAFVDFQARHARGEATQAWTHVLSAVERAAETNAPARRLLDEWTVMTGPLAP